MPKPVILTVDDDQEVLRAVQRDLRRQYGEDYRVVAAASGAEALEAVRELNLRNEPIALLLVDQRMPEMTGIQFLAQTIERIPDAKRALLTAYADTEAAIAAINEVSLDHYIMKPWDPPEERLYPIVDDLLEDWWAGFVPRFEGITVIGNRWGRATHEARAFLARNQVPYRSLDLGTDEEAEVLLGDVGASTALLPVVLMPDGTSLIQPSLSDIAGAIGLKTQPAQPSYDLVIVGAGPAGLAAAVYGASEGLATLLVESEAPGGQAGQSSRIENYLGFPKGVSGSDLARRAVTQATRFGAEILTPAEVVSVTRNDPFRTVGFSDGTRGQHQSPADHHRGLLHQARFPGCRRPDRCRRLLRDFPHRGRRPPRRAHVHHRCRELRRTGSHVPQSLRVQCHHPGPGPVLDRIHVAIPDRCDLG